MVVGHGYSPVSHREMWIGLGRPLERIQRFGVPERMQGGNAAQEMFLRLPGARGGEGDRAQFPRRAHRLGKACCQRKNYDQSDQP